MEEFLKQSQLRANMYAVVALVGWSIVVIGAFAS